MPGKRATNTKSVNISGQTGLEGLNIDPDSLDFIKMYLNAPQIYRDASKMYISAPQPDRDTLTNIIHTINPIQASFTPAAPAPQLQIMPATASGKPECPHFERCEQSRTSLERVNFEMSTQMYRSVQLLTEIKIDMEKTAEVIVKLIDKLQPRSP